MIKNFIILVSVLISNTVMLVVAGCDCPAFNEICTKACVKTMASCVTRCKSGNTDSCVNRCFEVYWPIVKRTTISDAQQELTETSSTPVKIARRDHHESDEVEDIAGNPTILHEEHSSGNAHPDGDHSTQNESPVKVYTTVTTHTTLFADPTPQASPHPSETPTNGGTKEGGKDTKGEKSMAITEHGSNTIMITTLAVASAWLLMA